jgi:hypothetical protein
MADDPKKSYYNVKRSRDEFAFEEVDNDFPYKINTIGISLKKKVIFNYSSEYFRKKVGQGQMGLYQIFGGNIPSDMEATKTFASTELAGAKNPPPPLICNLNKGSATRFKKITALNLSPNLIQDFPTKCDDTLQTKPIYYETGQQQKPNFLYFTSYQHSNSRHFRAEGDAHEDNYDCLKYYKGGAGDASGFCCQDMCNCIKGLKLFYKSIENISIQDPKGVIINKQRPSFRENTSVLNKFCCSDTNLPELTKTSLCNGEVGPDNCDFGFLVSEGWPPGAMNANWKGCKGPYYDEEYTGDGNPTLNPDGTIRRYLIGGFRSIIFHGGGNTNCGCTGRGGEVSVAGYNDCVGCRYWSPGEPFIDTIECTDKPSEPTSFCECAFTMEVDLGYGIIYLTTYDNPTYKLSNWKRVEITEGGGVRSAGCGGEILYSCSDVS